jgi:hypothetical protein
MGTQAARHRGQRSVVFGLGFVAVLSAVLLASAGRAHAAGTQIVDQSQHTTNRGTASANSGGNRAVGNNSVNTATGNQGAFAGRGGIANNSGAARNTSGGSAGINTGDADATGTSAHTTARQTANTAGDGSQGVGIVDQSSHVDNAGAAVARTGNNAAVGNNSDNAAHTNQVAAAGRGNGRSVANNSAATSNDSDGRANINTGDADATGVDATTNVDQAAHGGGDGRGGVSIVDQTSSIDNRGAAAALTGDNRAIGNNSFNTAGTNTRSFAGRAGRAGTSVANNSGGSANHSSGSASITTGSADATGVDATTNTTQTASGGTSARNALAIIDENAPVTNRGTALARTGGNAGVGNNTDNLSHRFLRALAGRAGFFRGRSVANNSGSASNHSGGTTRIVTGDASAVGTIVRTVIRQIRG